MREDTRKRKIASASLRHVGGEEWLREQVIDVMLRGKAALDEAMGEMGRMLAEALMSMERESLSGPDYQPTSALRKWASQPGSVYVGDQKVRVERPRVRGPDGEVALRTYGQLRRPGSFSEELLQKAVRGLSARQYEETVTDTAASFGVSPSSVSRHLVEATSSQLKALRERDLSAFVPFAIFIDTIHRGKAAFLVALGVGIDGTKMPLGFWEGASENHDLCTELLGDLEQRGLRLKRRLLFITDGGKGIIKSLRERFGKRLLHQRCTVHKKRNLERHLAQKYRKEAARRFDAAIGQAKYADAHAMLKELEAWLETLNHSAAESLREAFDELLTLHRLKVPAALRKALHTTNAIESMFSVVRDAESNIKRYRNSKMAQRWLAASMLHAQRSFRRLRGHDHILAVDADMQRLDEETNGGQKAA